MASKILSAEEFVSLSAIGDAAANSLAPAIPAAHSARLIGMGYMVDLEGRLRLTTTGRYRTYAGQFAKRP